MKESLPVLPEKIEKEAVVNAYSKFIEQGIDSPDELDLDDLGVKEAQELFDKWRDKLEDNARSNFDVTRFYVEAGFNNPDYMMYILAWLYNDAGELDKDATNEELTQLRQDYADEMRKIRKMLGKEDGQNI